MTAEVAIIGAGIVGKSWAICFARAGLVARLYDSAAGVAEAARADISAQLAGLAEHGLLNGTCPDETLDRIRPAASLQEALGHAVHVQENGPERLTLKQALTREIDALAPADVPIASSTSALLPSDIASTAGAPGRCLVAHPLNPPHLIPAVEIVPGPRTSDDIVQRTAALMERIGQCPVVARQEAEGFIMNRLQGALLDEAVNLVARGIAEPGDIDRAMSAGLARRWSFMGPFETIDLNAPGGIAGFFDRYSDAYAAIGADRPARHTWTGALATQLIEARRTALPEADLPARQEWRDAKLAALAAFWNSAGE